MDSCRTPSSRRRYLVGGIALMLATIPTAESRGERPAKAPLHIGSSGTLAGGKSGHEESANESLRAFIKEETGMDNDITRQKGWRDLADRMDKGQYQIGVFQGFEFAWAQEKHPDLKPLALAVNVYQYPTAYVVVKHENKATNFGGLPGQSISVPATAQGFLRLFIDRQSEANGKKSDAFFSKINTADTAEDALDDVVDGIVQAAVADRASLEAYRRRKPNRFNQLKEVAHSDPFPPTVIAYRDKSLDASTLNRFRQGLLGASQKERGKLMLTMFRLTGFDPVPANFDKVLAATRKAYPPPQQ
jgi:ABC-type phosphate/phosphonate transport system substrate-binding protein